MSASQTQALLDVVRTTQRAIRDRVVRACETQAMAELASVAEETPADTIFAIDKVGEDELLEHLAPTAGAFGGLVLVAEGLAELVLPLGTDAEAARYRLIVDPIDGTRGLMYQKRSAWVLSALAPNRGSDTRLSDTLFSVQTEIPLLKQHLCDELWAVRGQGARAERYNRLSGERVPFSLRPSSATTLEQGFAMVSRFFPSARDELAAIDDQLMMRLLGPSPSGKALCFEDQYLSTGGQLYELLAGHDRFNADLRPLMAPLLIARGQAQSLCCHPYDVCTALIAEEAGVILTDPRGAKLDVPLDLQTDVAWVGYANAHIRASVEPVLQEVLRERGLDRAWTQP